MKISVVTTLFNYAHFVPDAVRSFMDQVTDDVEMIIVDDASSDDPWPVIKEASKGDDRVRYIRLDENGGYSHAKNVGIENAKAEVLVMLDADDMLTRDSLKKRYAKLEEGFDLVHGPVLDLRGGNLVRSKLWKQWIRSKKDAGCYRLVHAQSVMLRKDIHRKIGLYDESLRSKSDREMWARVFNHGFRVGWVDSDVSIYRIHGKQMHRSPEKAKINDKLQKAVLAKIKKRSKDLSDVRLLGD